MDKFLNTPIEYVKGVGAERGKVLREEIGVATRWDLLNYFPFRFVDRSKYNTVRELPGFINSPVQLKGTISDMREIGRGRGKRLTAKFQDDTGAVDLVWFQGGKWVKNKLKPGVLFRAYGKPKIFGSSLNITHPEIVPFHEVAQEKGLQPVYNSTDKLTKKGLNSKGIEKLTYPLAHAMRKHIPEVLSPALIEQYKLVSRATAYFNMHVPSGHQAIQQALFRIKFEELFFLQLELLLKKGKTKAKSPGYVFERTGKYFDDFYKHHIPFELTNAQKRVVKEIRVDLKSGKHMNRLLQGDVGSGKTLVALLSMLFAIGNGFQTALMAPTEILAQQHHETLSELLEPLGLQVVLLTGSTKKKERAVIHEGLLNGTLPVIVGTHALLEPVVQFQNLGFVVIDEQHRFGVAQRAKLWRKNKRPPHVLVMTATPIPRTLAMTFYGDLDVSTIDELPPGRKPVTTKHFYESNRLKAFQLIREEIAKGRQVYIVYPLIEESEKLDYNNLMEGYEAITKMFPRPDYQVSIVHGKMKPDDKEFEMQQFAKGRTQIMVATTVIEVGVNVPNATVMMIESAEKFGLSQLHQLRGRVGRGADQSFCILMTGNKVSREGKKRLQTMVASNDGFKIAEVDLEIRGPGDIMGTQQSGVLNLKLADLARDGQIVGLARNAAKQVMQEDPAFKRPENSSLRNELKRLIQSKPNWSKIS
ncbi:MAG: ATP-dependent DNA helicase RecG [Bacteroidota bacterium]